MISVKNGIDEYTLPVGLREVKENKIQQREIIFFMQRSGGPKMTS